MGRFAEGMRRAAQRTVPPVLRLGRYWLGLALEQNDGGEEESAGDDDHEDDGVTVGSLGGGWGGGGVVAALSAALGWSGSGESCP